jgi:hypothetical protein
MVKVVVMVVVVMVVVVVVLDLHAVRHAAPRRCLCEASGGAILHMR